MATTANCASGWKSGGLVMCLAIASDQRMRWSDHDRRRVDAIAQGLPNLAWERVSAGAGSKGERLYDSLLSTTVVLELIESRPGELFGTPPPDKRLLLLIVLPLFSTLLGTQK